MIEVSFEKNDNSYTRTLKLPDGNEFTGENINLPVHLAYAKKWPWERDLYEKSKEELIKSGEWVANALLGKEGSEYLSNGSSDPIHIFEKAEISEISGIPWEIAAVDGEFLSLTNTPIIRRLERVRTIEKLTIHKPLRMAFISASPTDCAGLEVENELLTAAMIFNEPISSGSIIVDEIIKCTKEKLREVIRSQSYDIFYFTGHGSFENNLGYLVLEKHNGKKDPFSANDLVGLLRKQKKLALVFLNCCLSAKVSDGWKGFGDVGRKLIKSGVPHVIATQSAIYDSTGRMVMKTFFENIVDDFNVSEALTSARNSVESDTNQYHDFYQFVHLSSVTPGTQTEFIEREIEEEEYKDLSGRITHVTPHRPEYKREDFVGRLFQISQVEEAWNSGIKVVGIHGIGGIGKTILCNRMEEKVLCHPVPANRLNHCTWIDFRENQGDTLASFLHQLIRIVHDMGFQQFASVVDDNENVPTILEKFRTFSRFVDKHYDGKILLILDNLETVLDDDGTFKDSQLFEWFRELITRLPQNSKVLVTSRFRFPFYPDGRQLTKNCWFHLPLMGDLEKLTLMNTYPELRNLEEEKRFNLLKTVGGHPYIINLVSQYYSQHQHIPTAVKKALSEGADYAQLDGFLTLLSKEALDWLVIAAVFPDPKIIPYIINSKIIRDSLEDSQELETSFREACEELLALSLITLPGENLIGIHPLVHYQLLNNRNSKYIQPGEIIVKSFHAAARLFMSLYNQVEEKESKVNVLIHAWDSVLHCENTEILNDYLQACASIFMGYVNASVISGMVHQVEEKLFEKGDEKSFYTIGFCAQTLNDMRHFDYSLKLFNRLKDDKRLPLDLKGKVLHTIGMVYQEQRKWEEALENLNQALESFKNTGQNHELGGTYHQVGRVYQEQRKWEEALENYNQALEWKKNTGQNHQMGSTYHQVGMVYEEQRKWEEALENYNQALEWNKNTGQNHKLGGTYHQVGMVYQEQRKWEEALENYNQALESFKNTRQNHELGGTYHQVGIVYQEQRKWEEALENYNQALEWKKNTGQNHKMGSTYHQVGRVYQEQRKWEEALENYNQALEWDKNTGQNHQMGSTYHQVGMVYEEQKKRSQAAGFFLTALSNYIKYNLEEGEEGGIVFQSLKRVFPSLDEEEKSKIKEKLPEAFYKELLKDE